MQMRILACKFFRRSTPEYIFQNLAFDDILAARWAVPVFAASAARISYNVTREAGQTVAGPRRKVVDGRKVRTP